MLPAGHQDSKHTEPVRTGDGVCVERGAWGLRITRDWSRAAGYASLGWTVVWFGIVSFFLTLSGQPVGLLGLLLALPGIAMLYVAMTRFLNQTLIEANRFRVVVRHAPLPWPGYKRFATDDIRGLHIETRRIHAKGASIDECWILIVRPNGKKAALLKGLEMSQGQMSFIAARMSDYLKVPISAGRR